MLLYISDVKEDIYIAERNSFIKAAPSFIYVGEKDPLCHTACGRTETLWVGRPSSLDPQKPHSLPKFSVFANSIDMHKLRYSHEQCGCKYCILSKKYFFTHIYRNKIHFLPSPLGEGSVMAAGSRQVGLFRKSSFFFGLFSRKPRDQQAL